MEESNRLFYQLGEHSDCAILVHNLTNPAQLSRDNTSELKCTCAIDPEFIFITSDYNHK